MEKVAITSVNVEDIKLPLKATVTLGSYVRADGKAVEYLDIALQNPFPKEDFGGCQLAPKWRGDAGLFTYNGKMLLKTQESFEITGVLKPASYVNKKKRKTVHYLGVFFTDPFENFGYRKNDEIEFSFKDEGDAVVMNVLARKYLHTDLELDKKEEDE